MKLIKSLIVAGSVAVTLGALQVQAESILPSLPFSVAGTNQFEALTINLTIKTQALVSTNVAGNTNVLTSNFKTQKISNQTILQASAVALNTTWPAGAKLALDLESGDVFVVDKTGQNPIYDLSVGVDSETNEVYFTVCPDTEYAVVTGKEYSKGRVLQTQTTILPIKFEFAAYKDGVEDTWFEFRGNDTSVFSATAKTASQTDDVSISGFGYVWDSNSSVSGQVSGAGSWKAAAN